MKKIFRFFKRLENKPFPADAARLIESYFNIVNQF